MTLTAILCAVSGAFFELHSIPLEVPPGHVGRSPALTFFANADNDGVADLFVLESNLLSIHSHKGEIRQAVLPQGVSVFDVADLDKDGMFELVAIQGRSVVRIPIALQGDAPEPSVLFTCDSLWANATDGPVPRVLVVQRDGAPAIVVPARAGMEYHGVDGKIVETKPYENIDLDDRTIYAYPYIRPGAKGLLLRYSAVSTYQSPLAKPDFLHEGSLNEMGSVFGSVVRLRNAGADDPVNWPWFVVHQEKGVATRAYCAVDDSMVTVVRTCDITVDADGFPASIAAPGPPRRYPGALVMSATGLPDFNGDGYKDVLLWNSPRPGISVDALLRAVVGRHWPVTLTVHLYSPGKGRFEPEAATALTFRIPVAWFLDGPSPLRDAVLADFNGDKKTDLGMCIEDNEYGIWLYSDGFAAVPDEKHRFSENITEVATTGDVSGNGKTSIVLRSDHYVYALYAK